MFDLALRSLRFRAGGFVASFVALFLGAAIVMAFASLLDTAAGDGVPAASRETLVVMAGVVGGWGFVIVAFAVASTLALSIRQREREMAVLKNVGATPAQIGRMVVGEAAVVALVAGALAILPAMLAGRLLLDLLVATDQVAADVPHRFGSLTLGVGFGVAVAAAVVAAATAARRTLRRPATAALLAASVERGGLGKKRAGAAAFFLALAFGLGVVTATVERSIGFESMQTAGQAAIWAAIGFALLAPALVRGVTAALAGPLTRLGAAGELALVNLRQRSRQMAAAATPIVLFVGIATGTLYMQAIENGALAAAGLAKTLDGKNLETLNYVVIGMIVLFAAIMLVNTLVAATIARGREFGQQRLAGATPGQVLLSTAAEGVVLTVTGVLFGSLASLVTIVSYAIVRTGSAVPDSPIGIYLAIVAVAAALTLGSTLVATRRAIRAPAVEAVAV